MGQGMFGRLQDQLEARERVEGISLMDILNLPDPLRALLNWMMRAGETGLQDITAHLEQEEEQAKRLLAGLVDKGLVLEGGTQDRPRYRVRFNSKQSRGVSPNLWKALDDKTNK